MPKDTDVKKYLIQRIAEYLLKHGDASTTELAKALREPGARVGDALKAPRQRGRWGIDRVAYDSNSAGRGHPPSIWHINRFVYQEYLKTRRDMPWIAKRLTKAKPGPAKGTKKKAQPNVKLPKPVIAPASKAAANKSLYKGPILTRWQPTSPYYQEQLE